MTLPIRHQSLRTILELIACAWTAVAACGAAVAAHGYHGPLNPVFYELVQIVQPDGRLLIGGGYGPPGGYAFGVKRLNPDGTADLSFNGNGFVAVPIFGYYEFTNAFALQSDGKIIVGGDAADPVSRDDPNCHPAFCNYYPALVRLNPDGTVDRSFNGNGKIIIAIGDANSPGQDVGEFGTLTKLALMPDGKIVIYDGKTATARVNADGTLDTTFAGPSIEYSRSYVQKAYVAYYGRPADPAGQAYWAGRMNEEGQSLNAIIGAFGYSDEFNRRFGELTNTQLVTKIYQQALGRDPDPAGLDWYVAELRAGRRTLQTITLDVLNGATTAPDSTVVANKLAVAAHYTTKVAAGCPYGTEQDGVNSLSGVTANSATVAAAKAAINTRCGP